MEYLNNNISRLKELRKSSDEEVKTAASLLERIIGPEYFKKQVELLKESDPMGAGMGRYGHPPSVSPLAYIWLKAREELIYGEIGGRFRPGYASARLSELGKNLVLLQHRNDLVQIIKLLAPEETFELAALALNVAAGCLKMDLLGNFRPDPDVNLICLEINHKEAAGIYCSVWDAAHQAAGDNMEQAFPAITPGKPQPVILYVGVTADREINLEGMHLSQTAQQWLAGPGRIAEAVVLSQGRLTSGKNGLTFFRHSYVIKNPAPDVKFNFEIYVPS